MAVLDALFVLMLQGIVLILLTGGAAILCLSSPRQQWMDAPLCARRGKRVGGGLVLAGLVLTWLDMAPLAGFFTSLTFVMLALMAVPCLGAVRRLRQGEDG